MKIRLQHLFSCIVFTVILPFTLIAQDSTSVKKDTTTTIPSRPDKPVLKIGGALRFNYNLSSWKKEQVKRGGDFGLDMFRINAAVSYKKIRFPCRISLLL
ncbi:hypothetical protein [Pedobacter lusitanus]|uniref:hypothetical protein n=1 Tax=Pedobacter lusitanus TaxID=1503925 RepID=UPI000697E41D|nr:hypothetical protein [Pedobacter lusitanus]